jgi:MarR family 2-MHQ and catechol resistance regulon transcriptional repressor
MILDVTWTVFPFLHLLCIAPEILEVESAEDRRVRIVALTPRGKDLIVSAFRKHSGQMRRVFSELSLEELRGLEVALKKVGKRAAALMEQS